MRHLFDRCLPLYIRLWPSKLILAIWAAPVRYTSMQIVDGKMKNCSRYETYWQALRITLRAGGSYDNIIRVIKRGTY